jgi:hypothetical protein
MAQQPAAPSGQTNTGAASPLKFFLKVGNSANTGTASAAAGQPQQQICHVDSL